MIGFPAARPLLVEDSGAAAVVLRGRPRILLIVLAGAAAVAGAILAATGTSLEWAVFARFAALAVGMGVLSLWCRKRQLDPRMSAAAAIVALAIVSLMLCAIISNVGLKLGAPLLDARLAAADAALGLHVGQAVRSAAQSPDLIQALAFVYNASGIAVVALLFAVLARREVERAWELTTTIVIAMQATALLSVFFPARGAILFMGLDALHGQGLPVGAGSYSAREFAYFYAGGDPLVRLSEMNGIVVFPSFHTIMALVIVQGFAATPLRWLAVSYGALTIVSTIPMGGHYVVDLAGGGTVWLASCIIANWACRGLSRTTTPATGSNCNAEPSLSTLPIEQPS